MARLDRKESDPTPSSDRDALGRFAKGCKPGPGRPPRATESRYLLALSDAVPPEALASIATRALEMALQGDNAAREWLTRHLLPREGSGALTRARLDDLMEKVNGADAVLVAYADRLIGDALFGSDERKGRVLELARELRDLLPE